MLEAIVAFPETYPVIWYGVIASIVIYCLGEY